MEKNLSRKKKISLNGLENVLSPKEMKNVKGGSGGFCCMYYAAGYYDCNIKCNADNPEVCTDGYSCYF